MPTYRVRSGQRLAHGGAVLDEGTVLELPRHVAEDHAVCSAVEEVDAKGQVVAPQSVDDLERFRTHERVGILRDRLAAARATVDGIAAQLAAEEQRLAKDVAAATRASNAPAKAPKE